MRDPISLPLVDVRGLEVTFPDPAGPVRAVRGVSFQLDREKLGIVGESGSGKSMTGRAIMRLLPASAVVTAERLAFRDIDLLAASERQMTHIRGRRIGLIMQDPKYSLNPVVPVGEQIDEAFRLHHGGGRRAARERTLAMLEAVKIREPARVARLYPHEVSGGMGQRVMIAMMLAPEPDLLIADEPTSALDASVQAEILRLIGDLVSARGMGLMLISHDLTLVGHFCDRVVVMFAGRVMEELAAKDLARATDPYTRGLLDCLPSLAHPRPRLPVLARDPAWAA
jgi:peptide/nickel transport system ATP-binding protein